MRWLSHFGASAGKEPQMEGQDHITLKWGTLKSWHLHSEKGKELLKKYGEMGSSFGAMQQHDTPEQKELICQMIDECNAETIYLSWDGIDVSKDDAKKYVREYKR
jgi:hypothetical protein